MASNLDQILILSSQEGFSDKIKELQWKLLREARFGYFDKESYDNCENALKIIRKVGESRNDSEADKEVRELTKEHDHVDLSPEQFRVSTKELEKAHREIEKDLLASVRQAIVNVRKYQEDIFFGKKNIHPGIKYTPIKRVGICVPGASAPLASTVIMTAVPAQVAGVEKIVVVSPPRYEESIHPVTLAVCRELGIDHVYRIGGAQAVAGLACEYGTIPKVDKIVGPGNKWVQTAKQMVLGYVGIDSIAGPSEVLIIADDNANPAWVAADMLSQAEHAPGSAVVFTDSQDIAEEVLKELKKQVKELKRSEDTIKCLEQFSMIAVFKNISDAITEADNFASEHLEIQCGDNSREIADRILQCTEQ
jgi:histidinol dehydrogenase